MIRLLIYLFRNAGKAAKIAKGQHIHVFVFFAALMLYSTTGFMYFEIHEQPDLLWRDAIWWSIVTMTTVGYGDFFPTTLAGRLLVGFPTMLMGISILGYILSISTTAMLNAKMREVRGMNEIGLEGHVVICHHGSIENVLKVIHEIERDASTSNSEIVIVDDAIDELPSDLQRDGVHFVKGNPAREQALEKANVSAARAVIILSDADDRSQSDNNNLRVALTLDRFFPEVYSVVECLNPESEVFFKRANVDSVVCIASLSSQMVVQEVQDPGVGSILSELTSNKNDKQLYVMNVISDLKSFSDVQAKCRDRGIMALGVRRKTKNFVAPGPEFPIEKGDKVLVISANRPT